MSKKTTLSLLLTALIFSLLLSACWPFSDSLVVQGGTLIKGDGSPPIPDGLVALQGGRIVYAGPAADYEIRFGAEVLDAEGGTILPGFIDAHTHSTSDPAVRRQFLTGGVTAVCDLGTPLSQLAAFEDDSHQGQPAARGIAAGPILTAPGGLPGASLDPDLNYEVANPEQGRAAVEDLFQQGAQQIKVYLQSEANQTLYPMLDQETLNAIVAAAHQNGLPVRAHVTYIPLLEMALAAGVDTIEHIPLNLPSAEMDQAAQAVREQMLTSPDPLEVFFSVAFPDYQSWLEEMAAQGIVLVPTLDRPFREVYQAAALDPQMAAVLEIILGIVGRYHQLGGRVGLGTDYNLNIGLTEGIPLGELEMLSAAGLDAMEVIIAATKNAAAACGQGDRLGTLEVGKIGDLIVVSGDPLQDLAVLGEINLVILQGEIAYQAE